jgi:hypothetical protein
MPWQFDGYPELAQTLPVDELAEIQEASGEDSARKLAKPGSASIVMTPS